MKMRKWLLDKIVSNPAAWLLFLLAVLAEYGNYTEGRDLNRVCDLLGEHLLWVKNPTTSRQEIDNICLDHDPNQIEPNDQN